MQLAYQFPERCERLVLVGSGGLGREVGTLLKVLSAPGMEYVLPLVLTRGLHDVAATVGRFVGRSGVRANSLLQEIWDAYTRLTDTRAQRALRRGARRLSQHHCARRAGAELARRADGANRRRVALTLRRRAPGWRCVWADFHAPAEAGRSRSRRGRSPDRGSPPRSAGRTAASGRSVRT